MIGVRGYVESIPLKDIPAPAPLVVEIDGLKVRATFHHLDGMYSLCYTDDEPSKIFHLSRFTPMRKVEDRYEIAI
jgi:hypothetical protein